MKIRNGFVSNSSSSSFIVAFPEKPKNIEDVLKFMFNGKEGSVSLDHYENGLSYRQIAEQVFNDINNDNVYKPVLSKMIEVMEGRYHYHPNVRGCQIIIINSEPDEHGGYWDSKKGRYFGSDKKIMEDLRQCIIDDENKEWEFRERERALLKRGPKYVLAAYKGGTNSYTGKPYTKKEIKAYDKYCKDRDKFRDTDTEFIAFDKERQDFWHKKWEKLGKLRKKIATIDAQNFLDDNKGAFIFIVEYADENGWIGGIMEHGNIFRNVPHLVLNKH